MSKLLPTAKQAAQAAKEDSNFIVVGERTWFSNCKEGKRIEDGVQGREYMMIGTDGCELRLWVFVDGICYID